LAIAPKYGTPSDVSLATLVAGLAAVQALAFLDGSDPATIEGTLEIQLPDWRLRRRSWPPHPECDCGAHAAQSAGWAQCRGDRYPAGTRGADGPPGVAAAGSCRPRHGRVGQADRRPISRGGHGRAATTHRGTTVHRARRAQGRRDEARSGDVGLRGGNA